ncbi:MAG: DUF6383 domain-containing protein [Prevotellaceae bacterium]|jgi:hypothetical protein|nr:DUF6383 domain-containing protein [Prevotellaceae bacterium]
MKKTLFFTKTFVLAAFLGCAISTNAQNLPVTINQSTGVSQSWITPHNNGFNSVWENGTGFQLYQSNGGMVVAFTGIPTSAVINLHRYRNTATCFSVYPNVYIQASADNSSWREVGHLPLSNPSDATLHTDNTVTVQLQPTDKFLLIYRTQSIGKCMLTDYTDGFAYLKDLTINGYVPTGIVVDYDGKAGTYTLNLPCTAVDVTAELWGGGGGGGGAWSDANVAFPARIGGAAAAGGGGGGAYINVNPFTPSSDVVITVGDAGDKGVGTSNSSGSSGGDSKIQVGTNIAQAGGGGGGGAAHSQGISIAHGIGGSAGTPSQSPSGILSFTGSNGIAGGNGDRNNNGSTTEADAGNGGDAARTDIGGGKGGDGGYTTSRGSDNGKVGKIYGGGGGGGASYQTLSTDGDKYGDGNNGAAGNVKISFDLNIPSITLTNNNGLTFCEGENTTLTAATCDNSTTYQWYKNGALFANTAGITVSETGDYYVVATLSYTADQMRSMLGIDDSVLLPGASYPVSTSKISDVVRVDVNALPSKTSSNAEICSGEAVPFTPENDDIDYTFTPQANEIGATSDISLLLENTTGELQTIIYDVTQHNSVTGCNGAPFTLTVNVKPELEEIPELHRETIGDNGVEADWEIEMKATVYWIADANAISYNLNIYENGDETPVNETPINIPASETSYMIDIVKDFAYKVEVTAEYDCNETSDPLTFAFDESGTTKLPEIDFTKLNVWTSNGTLYLRSSKDGELTIYNIVGKALQTLRLNADQTSAAALPQGVYLLKSGKNAVKAMVN